MCERFEEEEPYTGKYIDSDRERKIKKKKTTGSKIVMNVSGSGFCI